MKIDLSKYDKLSDEQWKDKVVYRGLHVKYKYQLNQLKKLYPEKIGRLQDRFNLLQSILKDGEVFEKEVIHKEFFRIIEVYGLDFCLNKNLAELENIIREETEFLNNKVQRLIDKYATTLKEIEFRDKKLVVRKPVGSTYYIDLTNGNDARTGLKIGPSTIDSTADTTHFIDDFLTGADDYINGSYVWNVTRGIGALISDFVAATDEVTLATPIAGMIAGDTYYILDAWLTIQQYTTVTQRSAGDIGKVRANTSQTMGASNVVFDEDGNADNYIEVRGCSVADDPWGDASDVKPIFDWNGGAYSFYPSTDHYWKFYNLEVKNSTDTIGVFEATTSQNWIIEKCKIHTNTNAFRLTDSNRWLFKDCDFDSNGYTIYAISNISSLTVIGCTFDGDTYGILSGSTNYAIELVVIDCSFGQSVAIITDDIRVYGAPTLYLRNCKWNKGISFQSADTYFKKFHYEDNEQVFEAHKFETLEMTVERETTIVRVGGADTSAKITPLSVVGINRVATLSGHLHGVSPSGAFKIWLQADVEKTINIYMRGFGWTGFPTTSQLFIRANYLSNAGNCIRTKIDSDEVITDNTTWEPFQVTLTPARTGFVYIDVVVAHYEASSGVYVDIKPVIT